MEDFYEKFRGFNGVKRINVMCDLFSLCVPFELRYFVTYLKDVCKSEYKLKELQEDVNSLQYLSDLKNLSDSDTRSKLIMSSTLLHAENQECSKIIFDFVQQDFHSGSSSWNGLKKNETAAEEITLLLTLVSNHPAFTFSQKLCINEKILLFGKRTSESLDLQNTTGSQDLPTLSSEVPEPKLGYPVSEIKVPEPKWECRALKIKVPSSATDSEIATPNLYIQAPVNNEKEDFLKQGKIKNLELKGAGKKKTHRIEVLWSSGKRTEIFKTYKEMAAFHQKLLQLFPEEAQSRGPDLFIPALANFNCNGNSTESVTEQTKKLQNYLRKFSHTPLQVRDSEYVVNFFQCPSNNRPPPMLIGRASFDASLLKERKSSSLQALNIHISQNRNTTSVTTPTNLGVNGSNTSSRKSKWAFYPPITGTSSTPSSPTLSSMNYRSPTPFSFKHSFHGRSVPLRKCGSNESVDLLRDGMINKLNLSKLEDWNDMNVAATDDETARIQTFENRMNSTLELDESSAPASPAPVNEGTSCTCSMPAGSKGKTTCMLHSKHHNDFSGPTTESRLVVENTMPQCNDRGLADTPGFLQLVIPPPIIKPSNISEVHVGRSPHVTYLPRKPPQDTASHSTWIDKNYSSDNGVSSGKTCTARIDGTPDNVKLHQVPNSFTTTRIASSRQGVTANSPTANSPAISLRYMGYISPMYPHHMPVMHSPNGYTSVSPSLLVPFLHNVPSAGRPNEILYSNLRQNSGSSSPRASSSADLNSSAAKSFCYSCASPNHKDYDCKGKVTQELKRPVAKAYIATVAEV